ncbi:hypothetical protein B0H14DRAFT_3479175 [Mycena olivaceomarginata]|nr:hypothetical protein B0H14DRAFT_3479175 [Mycena olivaceomarginata]
MRLVSDLGDELDELESSVAGTPSPKRPLVDRFRLQGPSRAGGRWPEEQIGGRWRKSRRPCLQETRLVVADGGKRRLCPKGPGVHLLPGEGPPYDQCKPVSLASVARRQKAAAAAMPPPPPPTGDNREPRHQKAPAAAMPPPPPPTGDNRKPRHQKAAATAVQPPSASHWRTTASPRHQKAAAAAVPPPPPPTGDNRGPRHQKPVAAARPPPSAAGSGWRQPRATPATPSAAACCWQQPQATPALAGRYGTVTSASPLQPVSHVARTSSNPSGQVFSLHPPTPTCRRRILRSSRLANSRPALSGETLLSRCDAEAVFVLRRTPPRLLLLQERRHLLLATARRHFFSPARRHLLLATAPATSSSGLCSNLHQRPCLCTAVSFHPARTSGPSSRSQSGMLMESPANMAPEDISIMGYQGTLDDFRTNEDFGFAHMAVPSPPAHFMSPPPANFSTSPPVDFEADEMEMEEMEEVEEAEEAEEQTALTTCFASMMELVNACATKTGLTPARVLRDFGKQYDDTRPRRANPWNVYQRYATHHLNRLNELVRAGAEEPLVDFQGRPEGFYSDGDPCCLLQVLRPHPTVGGRQRRFQSVFKKTIGTAVTVEQRDNFHVFYMQIGSHVNQDTELGDVYYSPGLAGFFEKMGYTVDEILGCAKTAAFEANARASKDEPSRAPPPPPPPLPPPPPSAASASASASTTVVVKVERARAPPQKQDYSGMTEAEKKAARKALTAERLARGKTEINDLRDRLGHMSLADVKINIFKGNNGFMWTIACSVLFRANLVLLNFPGLLARLPNEADPDKASNAWRQVDREGPQPRAGYVGNVWRRLTAAASSRVKAVHEGFATLSSSPTTTASHPHPVPPTSPAYIRHWRTSNRRAVPCADTEGGMWMVIYDLDCPNPIISKVAMNARTFKTIQEAEEVEGNEEEEVDENELDEAESEELEEFPKKRRRTTASAAASTSTSAATSSTSTRAQASGTLSAGKGRAPRTKKGTKKAVSASKRSLPKSSPPKRASTGVTTRRAAATAANTDDEDQPEPEETTVYSLRGARPIGTAISNPDGSWSMSPAGSPPPSKPDAPAKKRGKPEAPAETSGKRRKVEKEKGPVESSGKSSGKRRKAEDVAERPPGKRRKADTPTASSSTASSSTNTVAPAGVPPSAVPPAAPAAPLLDPAVGLAVALSGALGAAAPPPQPPQ